MQGSAIFSECGQFRHRIDRWWGAGPRAVFLMANPSDAGAERNDPTVLRGCHFSRLWGCDGWTGVNFEPLVATNPRDLQAWRSACSWNRPAEYKAIQEANLTLIREVSAIAAIRVVAWGNLVGLSPASTRALLALSHDHRFPLYCLGTTKDGSPKHPMARGRNRIPNDQQPVLWRAARPTTEQGE